MKSSIKRGSRLAVIVVAGSLALAACGSSSTSSSGSSSSSRSASTSSNIFTTGFVGPSTSGGTPKYGGQLTIADYSEPRSLNPTVTYADGATGGSAMAAIYDELVRYDYTTNTFVPELAQSLTSSDNKVWTLKLHPGVTFTNGQPLNSAAVLSSIKYYESKYGFQTGTMLANVASMTAPDDNTVVFTLRNAWSDFPDMLAQGPGMIMAPAAYANPKDFQPIGAGPFTYGSYAPGEDLILNANTHYFAGRPYLDSLKFIWLGGIDDTPKLQAVTSGSADTAELRDPQVITTARKANMSGMMYTDGLADNIWINTRAGHPGANPLVRQAISDAFDGAVYEQRVYNNAGISTRSIFPPTSPWYSPSSQSYNLAAAKKALQQAEAQGYNGEITYTYSATPSAQTGAVLIQAMLGAAGFKVTLKPLTSVADQVQALYVQHSFDIAIASGTVADLDPYATLVSMFSKTSPTNLSGWSDPAMDTLLTQLQAASTQAAAKPILAQIQQLWDTDVPGVSIDSGGVFQVWASDVHGIEPTTHQLMLYTKAWKG